MTEFYLADMNGRRFEGVTADPIGNFYAITHDCPFCGKRASSGRSLIWIADECAEKGKVIFPCESCNKYITAPSEIFVEECLDKLRQSPDMYQAIKRMSQSELLVPNWVYVLFAANKVGPVDLELVHWDGKGTCPGCGHAHARELSQALDCIWCQAKFWVNQRDISRTNKTNVLCSSCGRVTIIPPTVWCPICGNNLRSETVFVKLIRETNGILS